MGKVLMVVAQHGFRDEELFHTERALEAAGHECVVASVSEGKCSGSRGGEARAALGLGAVDPRAYDAVVFVGGPGARDLFGDPDARRIAKEASGSGAVVGAICIAPVVLANAGLLRGKRATVFPSETAALEGAGASVQAAGVVTDGAVVTASGPEHATAFGQAIARALAGRAGAAAHA